MNIFILDYNIIKNAEYHNDFHIRSGIKEAGQHLTKWTKVGIPNWYKLKGGRNDK